MGEERVIVADVPNPKRPSYKGTIMTVITDYLPTVSTRGDTLRMSISRKDRG